MSSRHSPGGEAVERQAAVAAAVQAPDGVADRLEHALDLVLAALVERELDGVGAQQPGLGGRGAAVLELDPSPKARERAVGRAALDLGLVDLLDLVARVREPVRELAVVREQERARWCRRRAGRPGRRAARRGTSSTTVGRPCGSRAVVTTPAGLCSSR